MLKIKLFILNIYICLNICNYPSILCFEYILHNLKIILFCLCSIFFTDNFSCKSSDSTVHGCNPVTGELPADIKIEVDEDREVEKIHYLFVGCEEKLNRLQS